VIVLGPDGLLVGIFRSPETQNLDFVDSESRRPFRSFIDPLLRWIDALSIIGVPISRNPQAGTIAGLHEYRDPVPTAARRQLRSSYRMEKSTKGDQKAKLRTFEDALDHADLQQLATLLNQPELRSSTHSRSPDPRTSRAQELRVWRSRDGHVQHLSFVSYFGVASNLDPEARLVTPLRLWLKAHVEAKKLPAVQNAVPTRCCPQP
jgi:hypothetical protein